MSDYGIRPHLDADEVRCDLPTRLRRIVEEFQDVAVHVTVGQSNYPLKLVARLEHTDVGIACVAPYLQRIG
jgi:hypothetical protein